MEDDRTPFEKAQYEDDVARLILRKRGLDEDWRGRLVTERRIARMTAAKVDEVLQNLNRDLFAAGSTITLAKVDDVAQPGAAAKEVA